MDIITRIKNIIANLYSKKTFRILLAIIFLAFVLKHYSSIPENIKKNDGINIFSPSKIKNKIEEETILKQQEREEIKKKTISNKKEEIYNIELAKNKLALEKLNNIKTPAKQATKKTAPITNNISRNGDLVVVDMIVSDEKTNDILMKVDELSILINDDPQNIFAKYVVNKKAGDLVIIPIKNIVPNQQIPANNFVYKLTIKNITNLNK